MKLSSEGVLHGSFGGTEEAGATTVRGSPSFDAFGNVFFGTNGGVLYCISSGGKELWNFETGREIWSKSVVGIDGTVFSCIMTTGGVIQTTSLHLRVGSFSGDMRLKLYILVSFPVRQ